MQCFVVIFENTASEDQILESGVEASYPLNGYTHLVASNTGLAADICKKFGFDEKKEVTGIVIPFNTFQGYYNTAAWDWLRHWMAR